MTDSAGRQRSQSGAARAIEFDMPPPAGIAALPGQTGWDAVIATVTDSVKACIRRLDRADLLDLVAGGAARRSWPGSVGRRWPARRTRSSTRARTDRC